MKFMDVPDLQQPCIGDTSDDSPHTAICCSASSELCSSAMSRSPNYYRIVFGLMLALLRKNSWVPLLSKVSDLAKTGDSSHVAGGQARHLGYPDE